MKALSEQDQELISRIVFGVSDINEHFPVLHFLSSQSKSVVELGGTRDFTTSIILASGHPERFYTVDPDASVVDSPGHLRLKDFCSRNGIAYEHIVEDTRVVDIESIDFLFSDSIHTGSHIRAELLSHSPLVSKHIAVHDTSVYGDLADVAQNINGQFTRLPGLKHGIVEFLEIDKSWKITYQYPFNNGLTVLGKVK